MKPQIETSHEQSRRLLAAGVNPDTADMVWLLHGEQPTYLTFNEGCNRCIPEVGDIPAWSLNALIELLPDSIWVENRMQYTFQLIKCKGSYIVEYSGHNTSLYQSNGATAIEACVRMIETLTHHKHSLNKIEE